VASSGPTPTAPCPSCAGGTVVLGARFSPHQLAHTPAQRGTACSEGCLLMALWTQFWKRRESLAVWVQGTPCLLSSGTESSPAPILLPCMEPPQPPPATHWCYQSSPLCTIYRVFIPPQKRGEACQPEFVGDHMKPRAEPHTSVRPSARLRKCLQARLEEAEYGDRSFARLSAESC